MIAVSIASNTETSDIIELFHQIDAHYFAAKAPSRIEIAAHVEGCSRFDWTAETDNSQAVDFYDRLKIPRVEEKAYYRLSGKRCGLLPRTNPRP